MFGLSWTQITIITIIAIFLLGPERIPVAVTWANRTLQHARSLAGGAQDQLHKQLGPELQQLRAQIAELQSLREQLDLREYHPARIMSEIITSGPVGPITPKNAHPEQSTTPTDEVPTGRS